MLKHPDLTLGRIRSFLGTVLIPLVTRQSAPLQIEINERECRDQADAEAGPWKVVGKGYQFGPAYRTVWFRLTGTVPADFDGLPLRVVAELGGERTVWRDNSPWCGIDVQHSDFGWMEGSAMAGGTVPARGGEAVSYIVQSYARNSETRVHGKEPPRQPLTETVSHAELVVIDPEVKDLCYDIDFGLGLLETMETNDPARATILRALNEVVNLWSRQGRDALPRAQKIIRDAMGSLNGEFKHTIYPVGHAHLDTAWLWPIEITKKKMAHTTSTQLGLLERYPEYVFVHSQASQYEWLEKDYPALFERVKEAIRGKRWEVVGSMWVEADCNLTGSESLVRQFLYGKRYFRDKLGVETEDMWLPDVFGYSAALPQILQQFDISYFLTQKISWNQFNKFPHHTFYWQGIDGSRIWTHFPPADTYNASAEPKEVVYAVKNYKDHARCDASLYVYGWGDGGGGPTERHLEFLRRGRLAPSYPEVALGKRALDFFREAKSKSRDLQVWVGELYLELHRGTYTSQAKNKRFNRQSEFLLRDAEWLSAFAPGYPAAYPAAELEAAWKLVLLNQFHDIIPGSSVREVYEDSDRDYAAVLATGDRIVADALTRFGERFDTSDMTRPVALFHNARVVTQGAIDWDAPEVPASLVTTEGASPVQLVEEFGERKLLFAVPEIAQGAVVVADLADTPAPGPRLKSSPRRIENDLWSVRFDPNGNITSLQSLEDGTEFIAPGELANVFQLFEDRPNFWSAWDVDAFALETGQDLLKSESFRIVETGPVRVAAEVVKRFGASTIRQRISLGPTPGVRFDTEIDWHEEDRMLKVAFPVNVNASRATYEIQFGHVERATHRNTSWDLAKFEVCAQKWIDLSEGNQGVALMNDGKYGHDVHGNVMRMTLLRSPKAPDPLCDMGTHRFTYALLPHFGGLVDSEVVAAAYALNAPLRVQPLSPARGANGVVPAFVSVESRNLVIESVKKAEDTDDVIVRLYECHNTRGKAELVTALPVRAAYRTNLEERHATEIEVQEGTVRFDYRPFEIITLRLRF